MQERFLHHLKGVGAGQCVARNQIQQLVNSPQPVDVDAGEDPCSEASSHDSEQPAREDAISHVALLQQRIYEMEGDLLRKALDLERAKEALEQSSITVQELEFHVTHLIQKEEMLCARLSDFERQRSRRSSHAKLLRQAWIRLFAFALLQRQKWHMTKNLLHKKHNGLICIAFSTLTRNVSAKQKILQDLHRCLQRLRHRPPRVRAQQERHRRHAQALEGPQRPALRPALRPE